MPSYYVNKNPQSDGYHEVHTTGCPHPPNPENRVSLGIHISCKSAVTAAKKLYPKSDGCAHCCKSCHTR